MRLTFKRIDWQVQAGSCLIKWQNFRARAPCRGCGGIGIRWQRCCDPCSRIEERTTCHSAPHPTAILSDRKRGKGCAQVGQIPRHKGRAYPHRYSPRLQRIGDAVMQVCRHRLTVDPGRKITCPCPKGGFSLRAEDNQP